MHRQQDRTRLALDTKTEERLRKNRLALDAIFDSIIFLSQQGLALRGHTDDKSNLFNVMRLLSQHNDEVHDWLYVRGKAKWLGHDLQNEILGMVADKVRQSVVSSVKDAKYFAVIADETTDVSRKEQVSVCVRYVTEKFEIYEAFLGFFETANTDALTLCGIIENGVIACGLDLKNCVGQSYDGAANMRGCISGVQQRMKIIYPKMLYVMHYRQIATRKRLCQCLQVL
ncbi:zinc finger MYM-type protein 1-like [Ciona intestinalis]